MEGATFMRAKVDRSPKSEAEIVTNAAVRAAKNLGISNKILAAILGLSEPSISRMGSQTFVVGRGEKPFELAVLLIRLYRSLDAIVGGDDAVARHWLKNENSALQGTPMHLIQTIVGLTDVIAYLDARRAIV
jgi:hypothetical protein